MESDMNSSEEKTFEKLLQHLEEGDPHSIRSNNELCDAMHLLHDTEFALRYEQSQPSDIEQELQRTFSRISACDSQEIPPIAIKEHHKFHIASLIGGIGIGFAATLVIMFSFGLFTVKQLSTPLNEPIILYSATNDDAAHRQSHIPNVAEDIDLAAESPAKDAVTSLDSSTEVLDMRLRPALASEECIINTPRGKSMEIILADGTNVMLSPESALRFPARFSGDSRTVNLDGEAYFDVAKDASHPFIVISKGYSTTALGTEFDVRAYNQSDLKVSLIEGSVQVENLSDQLSVILNPGEDVTSVDGKLVVSTIDMKAFKYWRDGYFYFDNTPLADMMVELGRWHNVNVVLNSRSLMSYRLHFVSSRNEDINDVVERLNKFNYLDAKFQDGKIIIDESHTH